MLKRLWRIQNFVPVISVRPLLPMPHSPWASSPTWSIKHGLAAQPRLRGRPSVWVTG